MAGKLITETEVAEYQGADGAKREAMARCTRMGGDALPTNQIGIGTSPIIDERGNVVGQRALIIERS